MLTRVARVMLLCCGVLVAGAGAVTLTQSSAAPYQRVVDIAFPVAGTVEVSDDYHARRAGGVRAHRATDVFAPHGRPVHAAAAGTVSWLPARHPTAGYAVHVRGTDGLLYAYYHLGRHNGTRSQAYAPGLSEGSRVQRGQLLGYVGDSGNAAGGRPHLHFEIHDGGVTDPYGTHRLNPYSSLVAAQRRADAPSRSGSRGGLLRAGDRGAEVAAWQTQLNRVRSSPIAADGAFGPQTDAATRAFQRDAGITADGVVGPQTRAALSAASPIRIAQGSRTALRAGDRGADVAAWQTQLNRVRSSPIAVDSVFGPQTDAATRAFQRDAGITADGIVGPQTRGAIAG